jgi:hypothetical protein
MLLVFHFAEPPDPSIQMAGFARRASVEVREDKLKSPP